MRGQWEQEARWGGGARTVREAHEKEELQNIYIKTHTHKYIYITYIWLPKGQAPSGFVFLFFRTRLLIPATAVRWAPIQIVLAAAVNTAMGTLDQIVQMATTRAALRQKQTGPKGPARLHDVVGIVAGSWVPATGVCS